MFKSDETPSTVTIEAEVPTQPTQAKPVPVAASSTKDAGRVHFGAGMMRF